MTAVLDTPAPYDQYAQVAAAPPALCASYVGARRLRVTLLDACGRPMWGPRSQVVSDGFVSIEIEPETEEGEDFKVRNANGDLCINDRGQDAISWYNLTIEFCRVDPDLFLMMQRTWKRVTDAARQTSTGWRQGEKISASLGYALEIWPKASGSGASQACLAGDGGVPDPTMEPGGYMVMPWVLGMAPESITLENNPTSFKQKGRTRAGSLWGRGPYKVTRDADGNLAPLLDPIDPGFDVPAWQFKTSGDPDHWHTEIITVKPPDAVCGAHPLWNPDAVRPTITATATTGNTMSADLTVTNFAQVGNSGIVNWGDGTSDPMPASSNGTLAHVYDAGLANQEQTIEFLAANGHEPVTAKFTPTPQTRADTAGEQDKPATPEGGEDQADADASQLADTGEDSTGSSEGGGGSRGRGRGGR